MKTIESPQIENGHIDIANELAERLSYYHLSGNEWMVLWVVLRKTWGWHKKEDPISLTQFQKGTELSRDSVNEALTKLVGKKVLVGKKGLGTTVWSFNKHYSEWVVGKKGLVGFSVGGSREKGTHKRNYTKETNTNVLGDKSPVRRDFRNPDIQEGIELLKQNQGHVVKENLNRYALQRLYKVYGKEKVLGVFKYACKIRGRQYAPQILNFMDLEQKWGNLEEYGKREKKELQTGYVDRPFRPEEHI